MNVTLRQLHAFAAVAAAGSFTRAAEKLHLSQSATSVLVRELEAELGIRLFDRTTRRVDLTDAGVEFRASAEKLIADMEYAVRHTHELVERKRGRITVAAPPLLAMALLPRVIADFHRDFPGVRVNLMDVSTDQIVARVKSGEADLGVGTFDSEEEGLTRSTVAEDALMLFCDSRHPMAGRRRPRWSDLKGLPLITLTRESGLRALVEHGCAAAGIAFSASFEVRLITTALSLAEAGLGLSVLPAYALAHARGAKVVARRLTHPVVSREIVAISRRGRSLPPAAEDFVARVQRYGPLPLRICPLSGRPKHAA